MPSSQNSSSIVHLHGCTCVMSVRAQRILEGDVSAGDTSNSALLVITGGGGGALGSFHDGLVKEGELGGLAAGPHHDDPLGAGRGPVPSGAGTPVGHQAVQHGKHGGDLHQKPPHCINTPSRHPNTTYNFHTYHFDRFLKNWIDEKELNSKDNMLMNALRYF